MRKTFLIIAAVAVGVTALAPAASAKKSERAKATAYGVTGAKGLVKFKLGKPHKTKFVARVSGLASGERLVGIDFRPKTRELVGLGSAANLYAISRKTGKATRKSSLSTPTGPVALQGSSFGIDFNPAVDRLRIVSNSDQNLRVNVDTGATMVDAPLAYAAGDRAAGRNPSAVGVAYTNNDNDELVVPPAMSSPGTTGTKLYDIDSAFDSVALQDPPNDGVLNTVGKLGTRTTSAAGFDILSRVVGGKAVSNTAYASLRRGGRTRLYRVSLESGKAKKVGTFGPRGLRRIGDIAIRPKG